MTPGNRLTVVVVAAAAALVGGPVAHAVFGNNTVTASSSFGTVADWVAPSASAGTVSKATGYLAGSVRPGGAYRAYANVTDTGSPASGTSSVTADVSSITTGATAVALTSSGGPFSVEGASYSHRSAQLTATSPQADGARSFAVTLTDGAANVRTQAGWAATADGTAPTPTDIQTTNAGTAGRAQAGDTVTFGFSEAVDPESILTGWTGASTSVVVRLIDGGCILILCTDDTFQVWNAANGAVLPFGTVDLKRSDYAGGILGTAPPITFGASGTASTMVRSGSTVTVTLGTASTTATTAGGAAAMVWAPAAGPYDAAGNALSVVNRTESGASDKDF